MYIYTRKGAPKYKYYNLKGPLTTLDNSQSKKRIPFLRHLIKFITTILRQS